MTGRQCKYCKVIKTLSGPKWICSKTNEVCHSRKQIVCGRAKIKIKLPSSELVNS